MVNPLLSLLQLCDSNFPSGAFSHSFGLETYIQEGVVNNKNTFFNWLKGYVEKQLTYTDGLACRFVFESVEKKKTCQVWEWDQLLYVQNIAVESREANRRIGERIIRLGIDIYSMPLLVSYLDRIRLKVAFGHPALAFAIICSNLGIDKRQTITAFLYSTMTTLVQNGVRGIPLGQTEGQRLLLELQPHLLSATEKIEQLSREDFGIAAPGLELAQMRHENLHVRLFMS